MNHYQKLGALGFKLIGILLFMFGVAWAVFGILRFFSGNNSSEENESGIVFWSSVFYLALGIFIFLSSKFLGKFIGKNLDD